MLHITVVRACGLQLCLCSPLDSSFARGYPSMRVVTSLCVLVRVLDDGIAGENVPTPERLELANLTGSALTRTPNAPSTSKTR